MSRRVAFFDASAEVLLDTLKVGTKDIPKSAKLLKIIVLDEIPTYEHFNVLRFFMEDESFAEVQEGATPVRISPIYRKRR